MDAKAEKIALFRYGLIAPLVAGTAAPRVASGTRANHSGCSRLIVFICSRSAFSSRSPA